LKKKSHQHIVSIKKIIPKPEIPLGLPINAKPRLFEHWPGHKLRATENNRRSIG
jgi:hypothetical protein